MNTCPPSVRMRADLTLVHTAVIFCGFSTEALHLPIEFLVMQKLNAFQVLNVFGWLCLHGGFLVELKLTYVAR